MCVDVVTFLPGTLLGFVTFKYLSDDKKHIIAKSVPKIMFWRIEFLPCFKIYTNKHIVHLHHWLLFSFMMLTTFFTSWTFLDHLFTRGVMLGGIIQGLSFPDWKQVVYQQSKERHGFIRG